VAGDYQNPGVSRYDAGSCNIMLPELPEDGQGGVLSENDDVHSSYTLLLRARGGDEGACNELCARYLPRLRRWAHGRLPVWARQHLDTEDIVQDTLMQSVRQLPDFAPRHERAFCAYVSQALRNRLRDAVRRAMVRPAGQPLSPEEPAGDPSPLEQAVGVQMLGRYDTALQRLRETDRELVVARVELGLDYEEIAGLLDKPSIPAARVAVSRALVRLASEMGLERDA
jgi:RNA polymerase sigma factor (sigma-70 family)